MTVLVTGGAGFIGSHLVGELVARGVRVRVIDNLVTGSRRYLASSLPHVDFREADIRDTAAVESAVAGCSAVIHLAALGSVPRSVEDPRMSNSVNVDGTLGVLTAARDADVSRVLMASSSSVYGRDPRLPKTENMLGEPSSPYALTKLAGEHYMRLFWELYELDTVRLRFFNVFGPRQAADHPYAAVIPRFVAAALDSRPVEVHGDGRQSRDFTYVDNVVEGIILALEAVPARNVSGQAFNLACGASTSLLQVIQHISHLCDRPLGVTHAPARAGDIRDSLADNTAAARVFGYSPAIDVSEGIRRTWAAAQADHRLRT